MSDISPIYLALDKTASVSKNYIQNEKHVLTTGDIKLVKPAYSPFYKRDLKLTLLDALDSPVVKNNGQEDVLEENVDYVCVDLLAEETKEFGNACYRFILVIRPGISGKIAVTYRAVGGEQGANVPALLDAINQILHPTDKMSWNDLTFKPERFTPKDHQHDAEDLYGLEYLKEKITDIKLALTSTEAKRKNVYLAEVSAIVKEMGLKINTLTQIYRNHLDNRTNVHRETKSHVGLGNVENNSFLSPAGLREVFAQLNDTMFWIHRCNRNNPHHVTKSEVGLDKVNNYHTAVVTNAGLGDSREQYVQVGALNDAVDLAFGEILHRDQLDAADGLAKLTQSKKVNHSNIPDILNRVPADVLQFRQGGVQNHSVLFTVIGCRSPRTFFSLALSKLKCAIPSQMLYLVKVYRNAELMGYFSFEAGHVDAVYTPIGNHDIVELGQESVLSFKGQALADSTIKDISLSLFGAIAP